LTYNDFKPGSSDIDLVVITKNRANAEEIEKIKLFHEKIGKIHCLWKDRIKCSYVPMEMLSYILPPKEPRPYFGGDIFYEEAPYGNEWIINNYLLFQHGISIIGPDFKKLIKPH
jgi:hypothetical protein